eukprot:m.97823 g.97823  ORF g.97823 m.97823 type:complete len:338 (+) comp8680_c0_seq2:90-1103(+)
MSSPGAPSSMQLALGPNPHPSPSVPETTNPTSTSSATTASTVHAPRPPAAPTLQEALRWLIEAKGDQPTQATQPLNEADEQFLRGALGAMQGNTEETKGFIRTISDPSADPDALCEALDCLLELSEDIDFAIALEHMNAVAPIVRLAREHEDTEVQSRALDLVATAAQNNPQAQRAFQSHNSLTVAVHHMKTSSDINVRLKAVRAASSLVRDQPAYAGELAQLGGLAALAHCIREPGERVRVKTLHLLKYLLDETPLKASLAATDMPAAVASALTDASNDLWELGPACLVRMAPMALVPAAHSALRDTLAARAGLLAEQADGVGAELADVHALLAQL